ncbi:hypothetical protein LTS07_011541 [Exophiala sideris]|uniref:Uncharacterized protein n=1 Tax=Exophiala sideris TaxID=1016849 RepID=A0ABR0IU10_9EURO|nr:hypothetical protein LTS07_011541 [Exophiala sideris]KAK5047615.1 hypothetical protein LTR69_011506 [Exophiala sideris]KAK5174864.1 hypothetical protein LTR44_011535 [Eurotiomycetes sp. CCFEE 6388]
MWEKLRAFFKWDRPSQPSKHRRQSDPLGNLSELAAPPPIENREDSTIYRHHTLEENLERNSRGEDIDAEDGEEDILVRHHTLEENLALAKELTQEMRRQSQELRRLSSDHDHAPSSGEMT